MKNYDASRLHHKSHLICNNLIYQNGNQIDRQRSGQLDWIKGSILQDLATHHTLEDLCKQAGISPRKLHKGFIKMYGDTPYGLLAQERQKLSIGLLTTTTIPAQDIAARCGYVHTTGFILLFKKNYPITPERYRAKNTKIDLVTRAADLIEGSLHLHHTSHSLSKELGIARPALQHAFR